MDSDPFFRAAGKGKGKVAKRSSDARGGRGNGRGSSGRGGSKRADKAPSSASKYKSELSVQQLKQQEDDDFSDAGDIDMFNQSDDESDAEVVEETAAEKRLRMARELIQNMEDEVGDAVEGQPGDVVAQRLRDTLRASKGVLHQEFRARLQGKLPKEDLTVTTRGHRLPVTCVTISADGAFFVTGSKDKSVIKWNSQLGIKAFHWTAFGYHGRTNGHKDEVLCVAISSDSKLLASGGRDRLIIMRNFQTHDTLKLLQGHRGPVTSLAFRLNGDQLFSGSEDRTVKVWNTEQMSYVETLFGHQDSVVGLDSLHRERAVSVGQRDRSVRLWKIVEESQLVFQSTAPSLDCVAMISEFQYVSGAENGCLQLWDMNRKKPCCTKIHAHGVGAWISAVAAVPYSDLVASGSSSGSVRLWHVAPKLSDLTLLMTLPQVGWINSLKFTADGTHLLAGIGKEHRLGRWDVRNGGFNGAKLFRLGEEDLVPVQVDSVEEVEEAVEDSPADAE
eukprot:m.25245 g.25245  ORF g.25245 m.25245 type:complete len:503 (+) comp8688_c0_seq1:171-1679(+)